ncbi:MAG: hypothetical protein ABIP74_00525 [Candidatus Saccharimonas sp.]
MMNFIAIAVGIVFSYWCVGKQTISWLFIVFHMSPFSTKKGFYALYDMADDETSFKFYRDHNTDVKKYADYLKIHADARSSAYETMKRTHDALKKSLIFRTLPVTLAPAILFWSNWHFYILGVAITLIGLAAYEVSKNGIRPGFYQRLIIFNVLNTYYKNRLE